MISAMQATVSCGTQLSLNAGKQPQPRAFPKRETLEDADRENQDVGKLVAENAVIVVGRRGCCMSHVVKRLLHGLGVNPAVHEVDEDSAFDVNGVKFDETAALPALYVGGKLFGGLDRVMSTHISGELVPILKEAGALWL
ncbi:PREDICTED: glutaredoxin-C9 [Tarenaya hassleriana]|uniref:glutaredoxin-C9 n=1 Tax=Tarenaya hassleriana TaxID=28532 RepID=UPI00053C909E|nr:PREDICTED: glutaredoxin-C9 [Tarenaya hassleriana]